MKPIPFIDLRPVHQALERRVLDAFRSVYRRNDFILGEEVSRFEKEFARFCGATQGVGVSSGASALFLCLKALDIGPGDGVLTSPFSFYATASVIVSAGGKPEFVDVDPGTLNMDPSKLDRARTRRTRAILPVHIFGQTAQMDKIQAFARRRRLSVVEDACQAHGARYRGRKAGTWGDAGCFSFYPTKNLGGMGDGGMIVTSNAALADRLRRLRNCGRPDPGRASPKAGRSLHGTYEHIELGYNERLDTLQAAGLRVKLSKLGAWTKERQKLAEIYKGELDGSPARPLATLPNAEHAYHVFTVRVPRRDELRDYLRRQGIGSNVFYPTPLHLQPVFRELGYRRGDFPEAERASREVLSLPLYAGLPAADVRRVCRSVRSFYEKGL